MDVIHVLTCNCRPGFNWKNKTTYNSHFRSNRHRAYELESLKKTQNIEINKLQVKYNQLQIKFDDFKQTSADIRAYELESLKKIHKIEIDKLQEKYDDLVQAYHSACKLIVNKKKND